MTVHWKGLGTLTQPFANLRGARPRNLGIVVGFALAATVSPSVAADCTPNDPCIYDEHVREPAPAPVSQELIAQRLIEQAHQSAARTRSIAGNRLINGPIGSGAIGSSASFGFSSSSESSTIGNVASGLDRLQSFTATNDGAPLLWNGWIDASVTYSDRGGPAGFDGPLTALSIGIDRTFGESFILGLFGSFERSDYDLAPSPNSLTSDSLGLGLYAGYALTDWLVADGLAQWQTTSNDFSTAVSTASYQSDTIILAGNLTAYHFIETVRLSPTLGVTWSQEDEESYTDSLGFFIGSRTTETGVFEFGGEIGKTFFPGDEGTIEPWIGAAGEWTFQDTSLAPLGDFDVRLSGGVNASVNDRFSFALRGDIAGLAIEDYLVGTGGLQASLRF